jgi:hypothetical protein
MAEKEGRPLPAFCPRIRLDLRETPAPEDRQPGVGTLDQVRSDLETLVELGAQHINLDWFTGDLDETRDHERGWQMLALLADKALDLKNGTLR